MTTDPYAALGVGRDASDAEIKRAFRRRAARTHPDRGGDAAEFVAVSRAYAVLADPALRAEHDAGGRLDFDPEQEASACILAIVERLDDPARQDPVAGAIELVRESQAHNRKALQDKLRSALRLRVAAQRLSRKGGFNRAAEVVTLAAEAAKRETARIRLLMDRQDRVLAALATYGYRTDPAPQPTGAEPVYDPFSGPFFVYRRR